VTSIVDVQRGQLLNLPPGTGGLVPRKWLMSMSPQCHNLRPLGAYNAVLEVCLARATQVADPF
jgi:hypothetical protein